MPTLSQIRPTPTPTLTPSREGWELSQHFQEKNNSDLHMIQELHEILGVGTDSQSTLAGTLQGGGQDLRGNDYALW